MDKHDRVAGGAAHAPHRFLVEPHAPGATPLEAEEREGLLHGHVRTHAELNALEAANILAAEAWVAGWKRRRAVLTEPFLRTLHVQMFGQTWAWAGRYRQTMKNISPFPAHQVPVLIHDLLADVQAQHATSGGPRRQTDSGTRTWYHALDEIAVRFHHRLVHIHPWPNGNGRHARMATDLLLETWRRPRFSWGAGLALAADDTRAAYISALRAADGHDYAPLLDFVVSRSTSPVHDNRGRQPSQDTIG